MIDLTEIWTSCKLCRWGYRQDDLLIGYCPNCVNDPFVQILLKSSPNNYYDGSAICAVFTKQLFNDMTEFLKRKPNVKCYISCQKCGGCFESNSLTNGLCENCRNKRKSVSDSELLEFALDKLKMDRSTLEKEFCWKDIF